MKKYMMWALACVLSSCTSVRILSFEELAPAKYNFPADVRTVAVVNNMPELSSTSEKGVLTLGELNADGKTAAEALATSLADSRYFYQVVICDSALCAKDKVHAALSQEEVKKLSSDLGADLIFSLDRVMIHTAKEDVFYPEWAMVWQAVKVKVTPVLSIYAPFREKPLHVVTATDSVYWDMSNLPSDKQLMAESGQMAASMLTSQLVPCWKTVERSYFGGGCVEMRDAEVCVGENDWKGARELWTGLYNRYKKGGLKMKAAYNVALSYEMEGDFDKAEEWLDKAKSLLKSGSDDVRMLALYEKQLKARKETTLKLNIQMSRFGNKF